MDQDQPAQTPAASPPLHCLGGLPAPAEIGADVALLTTLPPLARRQLYRVLGPCLGEPVPSSIDAQMDQFCREHAVDADVLARAIKAGRFLLRQAAMQDLREAELAEDLARLGDGGEIRAMLAPGYDMAKAAIRAEIERGSLVDHGKVVERVDWRMDSVTASNRGENLGLTVAVLTLTYREGARQGQVTVQLQREALTELRAMCDRIL
jgi:hypothetical protein